MNVFSVIYMFFLFYKAKGNSRHPLCNPGSSKHFLKSRHFMFNHNNYFDKDSIDKFIILIIIKIFVIRLKFKKQREFVELLSLVLGYN